MKKEKKNESLCVCVEIVYTLQNHIAQQMKSTHQEWKKICMESTNWNSNKEHNCVEKYTE